MWETQVRNTRKSLKTIGGCNNTQEVLLYQCQRSPFTAATSPYGTSQLELRHHHMLAYMNSRALMAWSVSWPPQKLKCLINIPAEGPSCHHGVKVGHQNPRWSYMYIFSFSSRGWWHCSWWCLVWYYNHHTKQCSAILLRDIYETYCPEIWSYVSPLIKRILYKKAPPSKTYCTVSYGQGKLQLQNTM